MSWKVVNLLIPFFFILSACAPSSESSPSPAKGSIMIPTPTPTEISGSSLDLPTTTSRCVGLEGVLELQLLVGPAEAAGLEPVAIGDIPFSVVSIEEPYTIEGANAIFYENILEAVWGTYSVSFNMDIMIGGICGGEEGAEQLMIDVEMTGDQMVEVQAEGFQGEYPWSGTHQLELTFPLVDGAEASGEGWQLILHIGS